MRLILPALEADTALLTAVTPTHQRRRSTAPFTAFGGDADPNVSPSHLEMWGLETLLLGFDLRMFPGGHFYLQTAEAELLEALLGVTEPRP